MRPKCSCTRATAAKTAARSSTSSSTARASGDDGEVRKPSAVARGQGDAVPALERRRRERAAEAARRSGDQPHRHRARYASGMCRNIRTLHNFEPPATDDEVHAAAVQYVRKISGFTKPSHANEAAFEHAVQEIAASSRRLLAELVTNAPPRDREVERARAQARAAARFAA